MIPAALIDEKYIQLGFAGIAFVMLGVIVWMIKTYNKINADNTTALVGVIQKNNKVLAQVFDAINLMKESEQQVKYSVNKLDGEIKSSSKDLLAKVNDLRELILSRPCMKKDN
jgi:hypothetical protein